MSRGRRTLSASSSGDKGDGTIVRFRQDYARELSDDDCRTYNFNWGYYLESLRLFSNTGSGKPFQAGSATA